MFSKKLLSFLILSVFAFSLMAGITVSAQTGLQNLKTGLNNVANNTVGNTGDLSSIDKVVTTGVNAVLGLLGIIFLVIIIYAGFLWMTAGGNEDAVGKSKKLLMNSIIGLVIILGAYAISQFVISALVE